MHPSVGEEHVNEWTCTVHVCALQWSRQFGVWDDLPDRKPSWIPAHHLLLDFLDIQQEGVGVVGATTPFFPRPPHWVHCIIQKRHLLSLALPCTSLAPSLTCQPVIKTRDRKKGEKENENWKPPFKNSFGALHCSSFTLLLQLTGLEYFENFLSIIAGIFMCQLFHSKSKPILWHAA